MLSCLPVRRYRQKTYCWSCHCRSTSVLRSNARCDVQTEDEYGSLLRLRGKPSISIPARQSGIGGDPCRLLEIEDAWIARAGTTYHGNEFRHDRMRQYSHPSPRRGRSRPGAIVDRLSGRESFLRSCRQLFLGKTGPSTLRNHTRICRRNSHFVRTAGPSDFTGRTTGHTKVER